MGSIRVKNLYTYPDGSGVSGLFECEGKLWAGNFSDPRGGVKVSAVSDVGWLKRGLREACRRRIETFVRARVDELGPAWADANRRMYVEEE
jgi:hypothetical protein